MNAIELSEHLRSNFKKSPTRKNRVSDADYMVRTIVDGERVMCPAYSRWVEVMRRCLCQEHKKKNKTYMDVTIHDDWVSFMKFREWWLDNSVEGWHIDKDILVVGNRVYGPDTCIFVPRWLNNFIETRAGARNGVMIGACYHKDLGKYAGRCSNPITGKGEHLGLFVSEIDAHMAWLKRKLDLARLLKPSMDDIDERIYPNVVEIINAAK